MDGFEILAIITGLFLGYWLVSYFLSRPQSEPSKASNQEAGNNTFGDSETNKSKSWYEVLEVSPSATYDEVSNAYKRKISKYHPDKVSSLGEEFKELADNRAKEINAAYNEAKRSFSGYSNS